MTTEKIRVSASSVISSVADVRPTPRSWRGETPAWSAGGEGINWPVYSGMLWSVLLRRAFLIGSVIWAACIPLTALAANLPDSTPAVYGFAVAAYSVGHLICHQLPVRYFHLWGAALPVCARCSGIYAGPALADMVFASRHRRHDTARGQLEPGLLLLIERPPRPRSLAFPWATGGLP